MVIHLTNNIIIKAIKKIAFWIYDNYFYTYLLSLMFLSFSILLLYILIGNISVLCPIDTKIIVNNMVFTILYIINRFIDSIKNVLQDESTLIKIISIIFVLYGIVVTLFNVAVILYILLLINII